MTVRPRLAGLLLAAPLALPAGTAAAAPARSSHAPSRPSAAPHLFSGTIVHVAKRTGGFVVADRRGRLLAVHSTRKVHPGRSVKVKVLRLRNGTFGVAGIHTGSTRQQARLRGRVTYIAPNLQSLVVSARGVSVLVRLHTGARARRALAAGTTRSGIGASVIVDGRVGSATSVDAGTLRVLGHSRGPVNLEGVTEHVADHTLVISADDAAVSGASLTVHLPDTFDSASFSEGDEVQLVARPEADGTFTAIGASVDSNQQDANSASDQQGDDSSCDPAADASCVDDGSCDPTADPSCADGGCDVSVDPTCTDGADSGPGELCDPTSDPACLGGSDPQPTGPAGRPAPGTGGGPSSPSGPVPGGPGPGGSIPLPGVPLTGSPGGTGIATGSGLPGAVSLPGNGSGPGRSDRGR